MTFEQLGIDVSRISKTGKTLCPNCSHTRKNKNEKCLSVDIERGLYKCHNNCGFGGCIHDRKGYFQPEKKVYNRPEAKFTDVSEKTINWFKGRMITTGTLKHFGIKESNEWMPEKTDSQGRKSESGKQNCINFPYYRNGELVNIKYRGVLKNFRLVKDAELIFYNLDAIKDETKIVIVEGEIDCMAMYEAGILNCVSVPNGASKNSKLEYLDNCFEYFEDAEEIILATDNDVAGLGLKEELLRRFGADKCAYVDFKNCKDANEYLIQYGTEELNNVIKNAKRYPIEGIQSTDDFTDEITHYYHNGYPKGYKIGFTEFDTMMSWAEAELTTVTGVPSSGKSNFVDQVCILLSLNFGWRFAIFSPENRPSIHISKMAAQFVGKSFNSTYGKMSEIDLQKALTFFNEFYYFYNYEEVKTDIDSILEKARQLIFRYGIKAIVLDPYNNIEHKIPSGQTETQYISEFLSKLRRFKDKHKVHIILVAHPKKIEKENGKFKVPSLYDIAGSAHFFNKTDNGITVYRDMETGIVTVYVQKIRFSHRGKIGAVHFDFDLSTFRYKEQGTTNFQTPIQMLYSGLEYQAEAAEKEKIPF